MVRRWFAVALLGALLAVVLAPLGQASGGHRALDGTSDRLGTGRQAVALAVAVAPSPAGSLDARLDEERPASPALLWVAVLTAVAAALGVLLASRAGLQQTRPSAPPRRTVRGPRAPPASQRLSIA